MAYATRELWEVLIAFADRRRVNPTCSANEYAFESGRWRGAVAITVTPGGVPGADRQCIVDIEYGMPKIGGVRTGWIGIRIQRLLESSRPAFLLDEEHELLQEIAAAIIRDSAPYASAQVDIDTRPRHLVNLLRILRAVELRL